jgi:heme peroxidase
MARTHRTPLRGIDHVAQAATFEGRFGRMFRRLPTFEQSDEFLQRLAQGMVEDPGTALDNPSVPAGYTYLGQFIDHDVTFDPSSSLQRANDPDALVNFRTPRLDLDSLYGRGPSDDPQLYVRDDPVKLLLGKGRDIETHAETDEDDLPRNFEGTALIGDPRNDENVIVSGLQLAFIKLHNRTVDLVRSEMQFSGDDPERQLLKEVQRLVRWHFQWVVVHDFLVRMCGQDVVNSILVPLDPDDPDNPARAVETRFYKPKQSAYMPVEFSVAAYRFGHSMVRPTYRINEVVPELPIFAESEDPGPLEDFHGSRFLPAQWTIDWSFFFDTNGPGTARQPSRRIDTKLAPGLFKLPGAPPEMESLALRNLRRGRAMELPSGRRVATALGIPDPLTAEELGFDEPAPLWFYVLKEADVRSGGERLGPAGARIVAEVILGLLERDPLSYLSVEPGFKPNLPDLDGDGRFTMPDLIRFALGDDGPVAPPPGGWTG